MTDFDMWVILSVYTMMGGHMCGSFCNGEGTMNHVALALTRI